MMNRRRLLKLALLALPAAGIGLGAACGGVDQKDYDAVKKQLTDQEGKAAALQKQLSDVQQQAAAKAKEAATPAQKVLLASKSVTAAPPRPTPTPLPAGVTPAPPPTPRASFFEPVGLFIYADTVTAGPAESKFNVDATGISAPSCVITSVFSRGMHLVWRFEVIEASSGKRLTAVEVDKAVVRLPTGEEIAGRFGRHGSTDDAPWFWTSAWDIPLTYPLGVLDWQLTVTTKNGKTGTYKPWNVSIPERGVEARTQILE